MGKKALVILLLIGGYYMWDRNRKLQMQIEQYTQYRGPNAWQNPKYRNVAPAPPRGSEAWKQWINSIVSIYGDIRDLFQEGGPFQKEKREDIYDVVNEGIPV